MQKPTIPKNEEKRIHELNSYDVIGEIEQDDYDFLTQMAAEICGTKISLISLVTEDKQWFLSHHGLNARETPKELAFCAHAINKPDEVFIVENATKDERFADNPLVTGDPHVIFYTGVPLVNENGFALGTLCVIDNNPKILTENQINSLKLLSSQVIKLFELRRKSKQLLQQNTELNKISDLFNESQRINQFGVWELDVVTGQTVWTEEIFAIHEVPKDFDHNKATAINFYHPDDRSIILKAIENTFATGEPFDVTCRINTAKNNQKWVRSSGKVWIENGKIIKLIGTFQDITTLKKSELKYRGIFNSTFTFVGLLDPIGIVLETNETALNKANLKPEDVTGKFFWDCYWWQISEEAKEKLKENFKKVIKGEEVVYEEVLWMANHTPVTVLFSMKPVFDDQNNLLYIIPEGRPIQEIVDDRYRVKSVLEGTNVGTWEWNIQKGQTIYNERWAEIIGYTLKELGRINNSFWRTNIHPEDLIESDKKLKECFEKKSEYYKSEFRMKHKNGSWIWIQDKGKVFSWTEDGKPFMMYGTHLDITESKIKEEQLHISEQAFRGNFEHAAIGMALLNEKGRWLKVNKKLCEMVGYNNDEFMKLTFQDITHPDDLEADLHLLEELILEKRDSYTLEKRYLHKNGETIYTILGVSMVKNENGKILYFISQIIDITTLKTTELKLAETISYNQAILDASTQVAIIGTDLVGNITSFNKGVEQMLGYTANEMVGKQTPQIIHLQNEVEEISQKIQEESSEKIDGFDVFVYNTKKGIAETKEWTYKRKDGSTLPILLSVTAIKQDDSITGFLGIATDITLIKKAEKEVLALLEIAQSQNDRLKNFAYIVSHNLRSHSGGIASLIELIESECPEFSTTDFFEYLKKSSENLSETIKHLTEVVQINLAAKDKLETTSLKSIIKSNINSLITQTRKENITIFNEVEDDTYVEAIPAYLDSIVMNFITNAIKYSSKERDSYLKIQAEKTDQHIVLKFIDNGLGIDLEKHGNKLFGMYKTFHKHEDSRGIGLFISKNQIEAMDGKIEVESKVNIGTTFKIHLQYEKN